MKLKAKWLAFPCVIMCLVVVWAARGHDDLVAQQAAPSARAAAPAAARPPVVITNMYTGPDGGARFRDKEIKSDELEKLAGWQISRLSAKRTQPPAWHNVPHRRYIVPLSGRFAMEVDGGVTKSFGPGDIVYLEDLTGKGHKTWAEGEKDVVWMFLEVDQPRPRN